MPTYSLLIGKASPQVGTRIESCGPAVTCCLPLIFLHDLLNFSLNISKGIESNVCNLMLFAVFFEPESSASKKHISLARGRKVGNPVTNEHDERNFVVICLFICYCSSLLDGQSFVMSEIRIMTPDGLPFRAVFCDLGIIRYNVDMCGLYPVRTSIYEISC